MAQGHNRSEGERNSLSAVLVVQRGYALADGDVRAIDLIKEAEQDLQDDWPACFDKICRLIRYLQGCGEEPEESVTVLNPT